MFNGEMKMKIYSGINEAFIQSEENRCAEIDKIIIEYP